MKTYLLFSPIALIPSFVWLLFFILQKKHKAKLKDITKIFIWGIAIALPIIIIEIWAEETFIVYGGIFYSALAVSFIGVAFVEEYGKYLVVRMKAMPYAFFNEPQDAIIYMITAALGFAAIENFIYVINSATSAQAILDITVFRGISATLLHVVSSGTLGYFLALSMEHPKEKKKFLFTGILAATLLHGIFNNFIMKLGDLITNSECSYVINLGKDLSTKCSEGLFGMSLIGILLITSGIIILVGLYKLSSNKFSRKAI